MDFNSEDEDPYQFYKSDGSTNGLDESLEDVEIHHADGDNSSDPNSANEEEEFGETEPIAQHFDPQLIRQLKFDSVEQAEQFYITVGREGGFDIRRNTAHKDTDGRILDTEWVCSCEGFRRKSRREPRQREPKAETRHGCEASLCVVLDREAICYKVIRFRHEHNHPLATKEIARRLRCNRFMSPSDKTVLSLMTGVGIPPCKVMDFWELLVGGPSKLRFSRKDGYNFLHKEKLELLRGGDVTAALTMLDGMKVHDPDLIFKYTVDEAGALTKLFWCDSMSRAEFDLYGDVLIFYSTYKTSVYRFPLVIFFGIDNHKSTCIFGSAILYNETVESYRWLLSTFRDAMKGKIPCSLLTYQDKSMCTTFHYEFPGARHRLCSWHLARNARTNLDTDSTSKFIRLLGKRSSVEEFEQGWSTFVEENDLTEHSWIADMYNKRRLWAEAFFIGRFTDMTRTRQRAESMNTLIKLSVKRSLSLTHFLKHFQTTLLKIWSRFLNKQEDTERNRPVVRASPLQDLERHTVVICTKKIFRRVRTEISAEQGLLVESMTKISERKQEFKFGRYRKESSSVRFVSIDLDNSEFFCDCQMLESHGIPCRHLISVWKHMRVRKFPPNSIRPRWLIEVGKKLARTYHSVPAIDRQRLGFARIFNEWENLCFFSFQIDAGVERSVRCVKRMAREAEDEFNAQSQASVHEQARDDGISGANVRDNESMSEFGDVHDPERIRSRGGTQYRQVPQSRYFA